MSPRDTILTHHLRYRLWIAELNFYINVLRIFDESLELRDGEKQKATFRKKVDYFRKCFTDIRAEIDELRHEMHLIKMKLAAHSREAATTLNEQEQIHTDAQIKKQFTALNKKFNQLRESFIAFDLPESH